MINNALKEKLIKFRKKRDWEKFHKPKDLAISLSIESAELLENFQWKTDEETAIMLKADKHKRITEEIADIVIYLTYLCNDLGIDINKAVSRKLKINQKKYPSAKVRGSAKKYNEY
ncbi:MAG: nucleotide pyrophosphohydrolase [Nitrospirota bacterium]